MREISFGRYNSDAVSEKAMAENGGVPKPSENRVLFNRNERWEYEALLFMRIDKVPRYSSGNRGFGALDISVQ